MRRLGKLDVWLREERLAQLSAWVREGLGRREIAQRVGVHHETLRLWCRKSAAVARALEGNGPATPEEKVEEALYQKALEGSVTAQLYWLKNRSPQKWRDKPEIKADGSGLQELVAAIEGSAAPGQDDGEEDEE